ncbi:endonuclease, partial [Micromonospora ureilytica]
ISGWHPLGRRPTYPSGQPRVQLDHILADRHALADLPPVRAVTAPPSTISDHRPLLVDLG